MAGKFRLALDALAALAVTGVNHNYGVNAAPERFGRASYPVLVTLPMLDGGGLRKHSEFEILTPTASNAIVEYYVTHLLLYVPVGQYRSAATMMPGLVDIVDNYANAVKANPKLTGSLFVPTLYYVIIGEQTWGGVKHWGCRFVHRLVVEI